MGDPNGPYVSAGGMILKEADLLFKKTYYCWWKKSCNSW